MAAPNLRILNLEQGLPSADAAETRLRLEIATLRRSGGVRFVRVIHGYGSTGTGGAIRARVRSWLAAQVREKRLQGAVPGESFGPADPASLALAAKYPAVRELPDWNARNPGTTIVAI